MRRTEGMAEELGLRKQRRSRKSSALDGGLKGKGEDGEEEGGA